MLHPRLTEYYHLLASLLLICPLICCLYCIYKSLVRSLLEYGNPVWGPFYIQDQKIVESIQRRATRLVPGIRYLTYADRLSILNIPSLLYRRKRGDMITLYQIFHGLSLLILNCQTFSHCPAIHLL